MAPTNNDRNWLFRNAMVVSVDENIGTKLDYDVLVQDGIITKVGQNIEAPSSDTVVIDARNAILSPGFVDTHRHVWQTQLATVTSDFTLAEYAVHIRNVYGSCYTPEDAYLGNLCGALESLDAGVTCVLDHCHILNSPAHSDAAVDGLRDSRIRGVFCYGFYENPIYSDWGNHIVRKLAERKLLGPDMVFSHGSVLKEDELRALEESSAAISSTPDTELQMGMGLPIAWAAKDKGCTACIGVDICSNNPADMFNQMRLLLQTHRYMKIGTSGPQPEKIPATCADVLRMATLNGAKAMGLADLTGSITPGKRADLVLTRCDSIRMTPIHNPVAALVLYANASDVDSVFVDGVAVKRDGKLLSPVTKEDNSWPILRERLRESAAGIMQRSKLIAKDDLQGGLLDRLKD